MTTSELIKQAIYCWTIETPEFCGDCSCPYFDTKGNCGSELLKDLANRLEHYENYLREQSCRTCAYYKLPQSEEEKQICSGCFMDSKWKFRGDAE